MVKRTPIFDQDLKQLKVVFVSMYAKGGWEHIQYQVNCQVFKNHQQEVKPRWATKKNLLLFIEILFV